MFFHEYFSHLENICEQIIQRKRKLMLFSNTKFVTNLGTELGAALEYSVEQVLVGVAAVEQLVTQSVVDIEQVVRVFTGVLDQLLRERPAISIEKSQNRLSKLTLTLGEELHYYRVPTHFQK